MPGFTEVAHCRAGAVEVWKLLCDPARFAEWWAGTDRMERGEDGAVTRFASAWPDFAYPLEVSTTGSGAVMISCLVSGIRWGWVLEPLPAGCAVRVSVEVPEQEAARLDDQRREVRDSLARLVAVAGG